MNEISADPMRGLRRWWAVPVPGLLYCTRLALLGLAFALPISSKASHAFTAAALISWIAAGGFGAHARVLRGDLLFKCAALLMIWAIVGTSWSVASPYDAWAQVGRYANLLIIPVALTALDAPGWPRRILHAFMAAMGLTLALTLINWVYPFQLPALRVPQGPHSIFRHHIIQGVFMSLFVVGALFQARWLARGRVRIVWGILALVAAFTVLYLSAGRTGYLALLLSAPWVLVNRKGFARALTGSALVLVLALFAASLSPTLQDRVQGTVEGIKRSVEPDVKGFEQDSLTQDMLTGTSGSTFIRYKFAREALLIGIEHAAMGQGTGGFRAAFCARTTQAWCKVLRETSAQPHNQFLFLFAELGLVGVLLFTALLACPIWIMRSGPLPCRQLAWSVTVLMVVHACFDSILHLTTEGPMYLLILAALTRQYSQHGPALRVDREQTLSVSSVS